MEHDGKAVKWRPETTNLLKLIRNNWKFDGQRIFLGMLMRNASEALDEIKLQSLTDKSKLDALPELFIRLVPDKATGTLSILDSGIGMTRADLVYKTSAKSSLFEKAFRINAATMIREFVVGFYSAYLVAWKVTATTKHDDGEQYIWESRADGPFTVRRDVNGEQLGRGTKITLFLYKQQLQYLEATKIMDLVREYSDSIGYPVYLWIENFNVWQLINHVHEQAREPNLPEGRRRRIFRGRTVYYGSLAKSVARLENDIPYPSGHMFYFSDQSKMKKEGEDHRAEKKRETAFNELPDEICSMIFSSISDASQACKAATLSNQLMRAWTDLTTHTFKLGDSDNPPLSFLQRRPPSSNTMTIGTCNHMANDERVDFLVASAVERQIEKFTLSFGFRRRDLSKEVYAMSSLQNLTTTNCSFNRQDISSNWQNLTSLQINQGQVDAANILKNCPSLLFLELSGVSLCSSSIEHSTLEILKIGCLEEGNREIVIITPNLKELELTGTWYETEKCELQDVGQLKRVWFDFRMCWYMKESKVQNHLFKELLIDLIAQVADYAEVNIGVVSQQVLEGRDFGGYL